MFCSYHALHPGRFFPEQGGARAVARPQSARKAPPKLASGVGQASAAVGGVRGGPGRRAPPAAGGGNANSSGGAKPIALFEEGKEGSDDDVEVVHEQRPVALGPGRDDGEQGVLVKNILEAEAALKVSAASLTREVTVPQQCADAVVHGWDVELGVGS